MKVCYVCAATIPEDAGECPQCGAAVSLLLEMDKAAARRRFLFGSIKVAPATPSESEPKPTRRSKPVRKPAAAPPPRRAPPQPASAAVDAMDVIRARDGRIDRSAYPAEAMTLRGAAWLIDMALCLLFNAALFVAVSWLSPRDFEALLRFSLLPLLFVLLGFTALYFALFLTTFQKSLGRLAAEQWLRE